MEARIMTRAHAFALCALACLPMLGLRAGDYDFTGIFPPEIKTVYIVAPSSQAPKATIIAATNEFARCGYKVKVADTVWTYSSDPAVRARDIEKAWQDPETDLIICARGGNGAEDTAAQLDYNVLKSRDIPFVGFSNVSALLNAFVAKGVKRPITGPMCTSLIDYPNTREAVLRLGATVGRHDLDSTQLKVRRKPSAAVSGKAIGGYWSSIRLLASSLLPDTAGRIGFFEVNSDKTYSTACSAWDALVNTGYCDNLAAVVICRIGISGTSEEKENLKKRIINSVTCPVFEGYSYGHIANCLAIDFGRTATITPEGLLTWESYATSRAFDAAAGTATNVTEVLTGPLDVHVNSNGAGTVRLSGLSSYAGTTTLHAGTLEATVLAQENKVSSLGSGGTFRFLGGTFRYVGDAAATFGHEVVSGTGACAIENDAYLSIGSPWLSAGALTKGGSGTLALAAASNRFDAATTVHAGTLKLVSGETAFNGDLCVNDSVGGGKSAKTALRVIGGTHATQNVYIGQDSALGGEYWADFIMSGGTVNMATGCSLFLGNQDAAHVNMDVSGGTLNVGKHLSVCFKTGAVDKDIRITVRDGGKVCIGDGKFLYFNGKKTDAALTVKDGGTLETPVICRYAVNSLSPHVLFDGGNVGWRDQPLIFMKNGDASYELTEPLRIGTKGAAFAGLSRDKRYRYTVAMLSSNTVEGVAQGVSFATGTHSLEAANGWDGPTAAAGDAVLEAVAEGALPQATVVTVEEGGALVICGADQSCAGLVLNGGLDLAVGRKLALGDGGASGSGVVTLYADAGRSSPVAAPGTYPVMTAPLAARAALEAFAQTAACANEGGFLAVSEDGSCAVLNVRIAGASDQPDCGVEGTNGASTVVFQCVGEVETVGGVRYLKPGVPAHLKARDLAGGTCLAGWRDETTGAFLWGEEADVTPAGHTVYTAVFGPAWFWDAGNAALSNGIWSFRAAADAQAPSLLAVTEVVSSPDGIAALNFATPVTNASGEAFAIVRLGDSTTGKSLFALAGSSEGRHVGSLCIGGSVKQVGYGAFQSCSNLTGWVSMPAGLTNVADRAFDSCTGLRGADLADVRNVGAYAFRGCVSLETVRLSEGLKAVGRYAFSGDVSLSRVTPFLPDALEEVGREAFCECAALGGGLWLRGAKRVCRSAFMHTGIGSAAMPSVTNVGCRAFSNVPATNFVFGAARVGFEDEESDPADSRYAGWGREPFYCNTNLVRRFTFPGLAPELRVVEAGSRAAGIAKMFGSGRQNGRTILHGSWRADPAGWNAILGEIGSADVAGRTPEAELRPCDRRVRGYFQWLGADGASARCWGWLVDTPAPDEPRRGSMLFME